MQNTTIYEICFYNKLLKINQTGILSQNTENEFVDVGIQETDIHIC